MSACVRACVCVWRMISNICVSVYVCQCLCLSSCMSLCVCVGLGMLACVCVCQVAEVVSIFADIIPAQVSVPIPGIKARRSPAIYQYMNCVWGSSVCLGSTDGAV